MKYILIILLIGTCLHGQAQTPFIHSVEVEYANAIFDPFQGIQLKANHAWKTSEKRTILSGISLAGLVRPGSSPTTTGTLEESYLGYRVLAHTGILRDYGQQGKVYGMLDVFFGVRGYQISGSLDQVSQGFDRTFSAHTLKFDWGFRTGFGYRISDRLAAQLSVTASFVDVDNPLGPWAGVLFWGPDVISTIGVGVNYRL